MCGPILFRKREARMKQIVIEIEDEAYEPFMGAFYGNVASLSCCKGGEYQR